MQRQARSHALAAEQVIRSQFERQRAAPAVAARGFAGAV